MPYNDDAPVTGDRTPLDATADRSVACVELVALASDYLEGTISPELQERIDAHLAGCEGCTTYMDQLRGVVEAAGHLTPEAVPEEAVDRLLDAFRAARSA